MNRARATGRGRPTFRRRIRVPLVALACAVSIAGCFDASTPSGSPSRSEESASPSALESLPPSTSFALDTPVPSSEPPSNEPSPTEASASESPAVPSVSPSGGGTASADSCSGTEANRDFYAAVVEGVGWDVYCPVLPAGWFVDSGSFRLADGGWMVIAYNGPADARFELSEGGFCRDADGCVPAGSSSGDAAFGDRQGELVAMTDGSWAVSVDRGAPISWLVVGRGIDAETFLDFAAALLRIS